MNDNWRTSIGYICIAMVVVSWLLLVGWAMTPNEFIFRIEMDNNTRKAMQSINYSEISDQDRICYSEICYIDIENNIQVGGCTMSKVDCYIFKEKYALSENDGGRE